ncbi:Aste57867_13763 [Aphanomyces stellatus]|uniref:Aste57867_13763 protein n=1 Tax=Aphanomyces stellatus TaxID=120398 RepID=A0A485KZC0_9STRA|nr:hypothetical protein As57867_013713 [Aphanomyces stellatus]VFT90596.1 Aste57867_13763 [Aphanomyces stellatus]
MATPPGIQTTDLEYRPISPHSSSLSSSPIDSLSPHGKSPHRQRRCNCSMSSSPRDSSSLVPPVLAPTAVLHRGMLYKRGQGGLFHRASWKLREVVLTPTSLRYYDLHVRKGELDLTRCTARCVQVLPRGDAPWNGERHTTGWRFALHTPKRRMLFAALTEDEMNVWVRHLHVAIAMCRRDDRVIYHMPAVVERQRTISAALMSPRHRPPPPSPLRGAENPKDASPRTAVSVGQSHAILLQAHRKRTCEMDALVEAMCSRSFAATELEVEF